VTLAACMRSSIGPTPASSLPQKLLATALSAWSVSRCYLFHIHDRETEGGSVAAAPPMAPCVYCFSDRELRELAKWARKRMLACVLGEEYGVSDMQSRRLSQVLTVDQGALAVYQWTPVLTASNITIATRAPRGSANRRL
jgi:hypothetical protein